MNTNIVDLFLEEKNPSDLLALYELYLYVSKIHNTNYIKCNTLQTSNLLKWSEEKVRKTKKVLIQLNLIKDVQKLLDNGQIEGHYIKIIGELHE